MVASQDDLALRSWRALLRSHATILRALDAELSQGTGLSIRAYEVLVRLSHAPDGAMRMADLAASVYLSPSGITRLVDHLVTRGLVQRRQDPSDARGHFAMLTKQGVALVSKASRVYTRGVKKHFAARLAQSQLLAVAEALESFLTERPGGGTAGEQGQ